MTATMKKGAEHLRKVVKDWHDRESRQEFERIFAKCYDAAHRGSHHIYYTFETDATQRAVIKLLRKDGLRVQASVCDWKISW